MFCPTVFTLALFLLIRTISGAALPVDETRNDLEVVEVIPGAGLPTLKELGVTSADLFKSDYLESRNLTMPTRRFVEPKAAYTPACGNKAPTTRGNAIACRNYLITVGSAYCDVPNDYNTLCTVGDAEIIGWNYYSLAGGVVSYCSDVAVGAAWTIDNCSGCPGDSCPVEGSQVANNSPSYVVYIDRIYSSQKRRIKNHRR